jgi:hypothetical protein
MERWVIVGFTLALFLGLAVMGWRYRPGRPDSAICASAEAQCGDRPYQGAP